MIDQNHPFFPKLRDLMREVSASTPVFDLGTSQRFSKEVGLFRELFAPETYFAGGYAPSGSERKDSCDFQCDVQSLTGIVDASVGSVLSMEVLEHVEDPNAAAREMFRIIRPGGICVIAVPFLWTYHGKRRVAGNTVFSRADMPMSEDNSHEGYGDYWRFTHEGIAVLLSRAGFSRVDVWPIDGWLIARLNLMGIYGALASNAPIRKLLAWMDRPRLGRMTTLHVARAIKA